MLKPIPIKLLKHNATMLVPTGSDRWGEPVTQLYDLKRLNFQYSNAVKKTKDNTDVVLQAVAFFDARNSVPNGLNFETLKRQADSVNGLITLAFNGNTFTLVAVEPLYDDTGALHHYELGLI